MGTLSNSACDYRKQGFSVIPLKPKDKEALHEWKQYQEGKATKAQIKSWWEKWPHANIGIVTGEVSGIVVIDCDSKNACESFAKTYPESTATLQVKTGKGKHFYFKWAPGIRNKAGSTVLGQEVDIRSDGGYVVAPPSIHPNGKAYKWLNKKSIQPLPKNLKEILTSSKEPYMNPKATPLSQARSLKGGEI